MLTAPNYSYDRFLEFVRPHDANTVDSASGSSPFGLANLAEGAFGLHSSWTGTFNQAVALFAAAAALRRQA